MTDLRVTTSVKAKDVMVDANTKKYPVMLEKLKMVKLTRVRINHNPATTHQSRMAGCGRLMSRPSSSMQGPNKRYETKTSNEAQTG